MIRWAYLGPEGTFSEQAAGDLAVGEEHIELVPAADVSAALTALRAGEVDAAVVPMENSVEGAVPLTQDELTFGTPLLIAAEAFVSVRFDLLVRPGTRLDDISSVGSHPHGHAQVRDWLAAHLPHSQTVVTSSTAAAAAHVAKGDLDGAAAAPMAGRRYGLDSLATDIGFTRDAVTRFVRLVRPGPPPPATGNDRTSFVLSVVNEPGTLLAVLREIADRGINLTRLESRPTRDRMGEYVFLVDADGHLSDPAMRETVTALVRRSALLRWLGSYPRAAGRAVAPPQFASPTAFTDAAEKVQGMLAGEVW